ncbi:hypothetical protein [Peristeroidobacter agariperforans]|uniref:hypothetical protein n=1 Tax=Peristeroidobacter agariperforans TaxID=268404 RepID=UPI00101C2289|nr:hypothetical protein [Peristeroidobacter agariperforans]
MARWFFVISVTALLSACGKAHETNIAEKLEPRWTAQQLQAFAEFKTNASGRAAVVDDIARTFPAAFNYEELRVNASEVATIPQERLVELLGRPSVSFSLVDRPEYLGASTRQLDFDPRELEILLYDVDCLAERAAAECTHLEAISLRQNVLRMRVLRGRTEEARALLSPPTELPVRATHRRLVTDMVRPGWRILPEAETRKIAQRFAQETLDAEFYEHGDVVYGRMLAPFQLIKTSDMEAVCIASASDVFLPSMQRDAELRRDANIRVAVFEATEQACRQRYAEGRFVLVKGESLAAAQLVRIHDLFNRRFASECDVPAWMTQQGLLSATGGVYRVLVAPPVSGRDRWSFDVTVQFALDKGGEYSALIGISPWGTRLKECRQQVVPRAIKSG